MPRPMSACQRYSPSIGTTNLSSNSPRASGDCTVTTCVRDCSAKSVGNGNRIDTNSSRPGPICVDSSETRWQISEREYEARRFSPLVAPTCRRFTAVFPEFSIESSYTASVSSWVRTDRTGSMVPNRIDGSEPLELLKLLWAPELQVLELLEMPQPATTSDSVNPKATARGRPRLVTTVGTDLLRMSEY